MTARDLDVIVRAVQQTTEWLTATGAELRWEDRRRADLALGDCLVVDEGAQLAPQRAPLLRGVYYESWDPSNVPVADRGRQDFLGRVAGAFERADPEVDPERVASAVVRVLGSRISAGEADEARRLLPKEVQALWG